MTQKVCLDSGTECVEVIKTDTPSEVSIYVNCQRVNGSNLTGHLVMTRNGAVLLYQALERMFQK